MKRNLDWDQKIQELAENKNIDPVTYHNYLANTKCFTTNDCELIVVKNKLAQVVIQQIINNKNFFAEKTKIKFCLANKFNEYKTKKNLVIQNLKDKKPKNKTNNNYTFNNFIFGASNNHAYHALHGIIKTLESVDTSLYNPIFIYGNSGVGKTHLLKATTYEIKKLFPNVAVKYLEASEFGKQILDLFRKNDGHKIESYKEVFLNYDVLLFDDIQMLKDRKKTNEILFRIVDYFITNNKQIVLSSDQQPDNLKGFEKRLLSRFFNGIIIRVKVPDYETGRKILIKKLKTSFYDFDLTDEAIDYITTNYRQDLRKLEGILRTISFNLILESANLKNTNEKKVVNLEKVKLWLKEIKTDETNTLTIENIISTVSDEFNIQNEFLIGRKREKKYLIPRKICVYLIKELLKISFSVIGHEFDHRSHSAILHMYKFIEKEIKINPSLSKTIKNIKKKLKL